MTGQKTDHEPIEDKELTRRLRLIVNEADSSFDKAAQYETTVVGLGYVGFFALWAGVDHDLPSWSALASASLIGISLIAYVIWNVIQMLARHQMSAKLSLLIETVDILDPSFGDRWGEAGDEGRVLQRRMLRIWRPCFTVSLVGGILGGGLLAMVAAIQAVRDLVP